MDLHLHAFDALAVSAASIVVPDGVALRVLNAALDLEGRAAGTAAWRPPTVHTLPALLAQRFERQQLAGRGPALDFLLSPEQELALWAAVVADDESLDIDAPEAAALAAREAWRGLHAWHLSWPPAPALVNDDVAAFQRWSTAYLERCRALRVTDHARLLSAGGEPIAAHLLVHGFLAPAPAVAALLPVHRRVAQGEASAFAARAYADREQELYAALSWAEATEAAAGGRVVVALDSLREDQDLVMRCVRDVFGAVDAVHLTARTPLSRDPRIATALALLEFAQLTRWDALSILLRSPSIRGAESERGARARADCALRALNRYELPFTVIREQLRLPAQACPQLLNLLEQLLALQSARPRRQPLVRWLEFFERALALAGWPGEAPLSIDTLRLQRDWGEVCDRLQRLDGVLPAHTAGEAVARLRRLLHDSSPRSGAAARGVFVVTPLEAALIAPTALWLAGCESSAFVNAARPSSCLPLAMQRAAGMPGADAGRELARARHLISALAAGHGPRIASYRAGDGELVYSPSPLLPALRAQAVVPPTRFVPARWRQSAPRLEQVNDDHGPPAAEMLRGGTGVLAAQAACPFRAYARHRLAVRAPDEPRPGLSALDKGNAVHRALASLWSELGAQAALRALSAADRAARVAAAVGEALPVVQSPTALERAVLQVERERLQALLERWLEQELQRTPFTVVAVEQPRQVRLGALEFRVRLDRVDRLDDGSEMIIDYKTGRCSRSDWLPPRMNEPQLPFYAVAAESSHTRAIAYGRVDSVKPEWLISPVEDEEQWAAQCASWVADLTALAAEIAAGLAIVKPKRGAQTCRLCEFSLLCRIREFARLDDDSDDDGESTDEDAS
jgi:probable DNA repair protein